MLDSYKNAYGEKPENQPPGKPLIARRLEEVEYDDPQAEGLEEVASKQDGDIDVLITEHDASGHLKASSRKVKRVPLPQDAEELRLRYKVLERSYLFARFKHSNKAWLKDFVAGASGDLADYLLGTAVMKLEAAAMAGITVDWKPSCTTSYRFGARPCTSSGPKGRR